MKNNQKIRLNKVRYLDYFSKPEYKTNPREMFRAGVKSLTVITNDKLTQNVVNHSGLKEAQVLAVLAALPMAVRDYCEAGDTVQILDLCTFKPVIHCKAVANEADCTADTIKSKSIRVIPIGATANVIKDWSFEMTDEVVNGVMEDEDGNVPAGGEGNQQTGGNTQQPTVEDVTYTFKYHDGTEDSRTGKPGENVDAPDPDSGYKWDSTVPLKFGTANWTFNEVAIAQSGGTGAETYTATIHVGSAYYTRTGAAGSAIELPELESGYTWPSNMPTVMPAQDFTAYAIEGEQDTSTEYTLTIQHEGETIRTEQLHADDIVFLGTAPAGYKWTNTPRYSKMPARNWTISTAEV